MFLKLAQALENAVSSVRPGVVKELHIEHIVNAIMECALLDTDLKKRMNQGQNPNKDIVASGSQSEESQGPVKTANLPPKPPTQSWANVAAEATKTPAEKLPLTQPLKRMRPDLRLMVHLEKSLSRRTKANILFWCRNKPIRFCPVMW